MKVNRTNKLVLLCTALGLLLLCLLISCDKDEADPRDAFVGTWDTEFDIECETYSEEFQETIVISRASKGSDILMNIDGDILTATVSGNLFTVPSQVVNGTEFSGSGRLIGNNIDITLEYGDGFEECELDIEGTKL